MSYKPAKLTDLIIAILASGRNTYKLKALLHEKELSRYKENSARVALSRLQKQGYISNTKSEFLLTGKGKNRASDIKLFSYMPSPFKKDSPNSVLVAFDIPESSRLTRNWLRNQLKIFNYTMFQQSIWIGPGPLPVEFSNRLQKLGVHKNVKVFPIARNN